jgi:hypothetical protein
MKTQKFDSLQELSNQEKLEINGGDTGYYGSGPSWDNAVANATAVSNFVGAVAHNVGDFFRGAFGL